MGIILIISLVIPAAVTIVQNLLPKQSVRTRLILMAAALIGLGLVFMKTKDDAVENENMKATAKRSEQLLEEANEQVTKQSKLITDGFTNLKNQVSVAAVGNVGLENSLKDLEGKVSKFAEDSKNYFTQAIALADKNSNVNTNSGEIAFGPDNIIKVPVDYRNSIQLDRKNQFAIMEPRQDTKDGVLFKINGYDVYLLPAAQQRYTTADNKYAYLVYKGKEGGQYVFYRFYQ